jgi:S-formylglutathione hydrolase FrmB
VQGRFRVVIDRPHLLLAGYSQGGVGALRMAFKYPERFLAVAAWAPGVEPALSFAQIDSSDRAHRSQEFYEEIFGKPVDDRYWQANHPLYLLQTRVAEIARSGLRVYLAVGGADQFNLFRGSGAMHSILEAAGVRHDYHLVADATHGTIFTGRLEEGLRFLGASLRPLSR